MFNLSLLSNRRCCSGRWSFYTGAGLLAAAVIAVGWCLTARAAPVTVPKKDAPVQEPKKAEPQEPQNLFPNLDEFFKDLEPGLLPAGPQEFRKQFEEIHKQQQKALEEMSRMMAQNGMARVQGFRGLPALGRNNRATPTHEGRLGALVEMPTPTLVDQLDLPKDQGVVVNDVLPESAAAKAGLKAHDILLELNGKEVPSRIEDFVTQINQIAPKTPVDAVVLRKGKKETIKGIELPEMPKATTAVRPGVEGAPAFNQLVMPKVGRGSAMSVNRTDDQVTGTLRDGTVTVTLHGKVEDGKMKADSITVKDGAAAAQTFDSVDKVPEQYRAQATRLLKATERGGVHIQVR